jgi:hypothetical protein
MKVQHLALGLLTASALSGTALATPIQTVFVVAMENHNLTQPAACPGCPPQILHDPAAPFLNSLMTPGNPNAKYTSFASQMINAAPGVHPSEPNYIWENAGNDFGIRTDADPSAAAGNIISSPSLTGLLTAKGITWKSYQEDVQYSTSPLTSVSGTGGTAPSGVTVTTNPYNGTKQYNYAVKHNPMAFFTDSMNNPNVGLPFSQLQTDLAHNTYAQFNWITPDQYNDMHSNLSTNFTYNGVTYAAGTEEQLKAQGDSFLSKIIPQLEATSAFQNGTGMIEIWFDKSEGGDTSQYTIPEIIISKSAVGNAFDVTELLRHSADLRTFEEIFHLERCLGASCTSPDLSAFFQAGTIPAPEPAVWPCLPRVFSAWVSFAGSDDKRLRSHRVQARCLVRKMRPTIAPSLPTDEEPVTK